MQGLEGFPRSQAGSSSLPVSNPAGSCLPMSLVPSQGSVAHVPSVPGCPKPRKGKSPQLTRLGLCFFPLFKTCKLLLPEPGSRGWVCSFPASGGRSEGRGPGLLLPLLPAASGELSLGGGCLVCLGERGQHPKGLGPFDPPPPRSKGDSGCQIFLLLRGVSVCLPNPKLTDI